MKSLALFIIILFIYFRAEPDKKEKQFINDSLRNDFHRKFMDKYIK